MLFNSCLSLSFSLFRNNPASEDLMTGRMFFGKYFLREEVEKNQGKVQS